MCLKLSNFYRFICLQCILKTVLTHLALFNSSPIENLYLLKMCRNDIVDKIFCVVETCCMPLLALQIVSLYGMTTAAYMYVQKTRITSLLCLLFLIT